MQEKQKALCRKAFRIRNHPCFDKKVRNTGGVHMTCIDEKDAEFSAIRKERDVCRGNLGRVSPAFQ